MKHPLEVLIAALLCIAALAEALRRRGKPYEARKLMSRVEQEAYLRLRQAAPEKLIFAQVQLCRFIRPRSGHGRAWRASHNRIAQLSADFVICEPDTSVSAVIEIDDRTHERTVQRRRDQKKDDACESAGIKILRWPARGLPTAQEMRERLDLHP